LDILFLFLKNYANICKVKIKKMAIKNIVWITGCLLIALLFSCKNIKKDEVAESEFTGSESCIVCHERFYDLWATSWHGKAMQHINADFIREYHLPDSEPMEVEGKLYQVVFDDSTMTMYEKKGDKLLNTYQATWSLGGRNVFCFLVPLEKGKLQTIPLAYDMNRDTWFNYPQSAVRHFVENDVDEALPWKDRMYTFNTGCYNCHVSQLSSNFDLATDTYKTTWREAGINCETCHGPSAEHVRVCQEAEKKGEVPEDLKIIITSTFTPAQHDASCSSCHAKCNPITSSYMPGEPFFDNFNLTTLEDPDFYPDGRDLGENYTYTGWLMNPCKQASNLNCATCHTSSGRNRFKDNPNDACISCHADKGEELTEHTRHEADSEGSVCINCHAPTREFVGRFLRSDHSFRPPMPEATIKFGSPNACNQCHDDKSPEWANKIVKERDNPDYQEETLYWGQLIKEARESEWGRLDEMLAIIDENRYNEVLVTSFLRLLAGCPEEKKWDTVINALKTNESPLVRAAAATSLSGYSSENAIQALVNAAGDDYRLVRISAALSLSGITGTHLSPADSVTVAKATEEYLNSLVARPDDWSSHYNKGLFYQNRGNNREALNSYETASRLYPEAIMPLINSSVLYSYSGNTSKAEENLKKALKVDPDNEAANLNLGLLLAEHGKMQEAEQALLTALKANPGQAVAAYNLSVISSQRSMNEAVKYARIARDASPEDPKYAYTLAYYLVQTKQDDEAVTILKKLISDHPLYLSAVSFLADIYMREGKIEETKKLYEQTLKTEGLQERDRTAIRQALDALRNS
jgi:tetratricopeptide (TPR) repeat protein